MVQQSTKQHGKHWQNVENRRNFLLSFAEKMGFDPMVKHNWNGTTAKILANQVPMMKTKIDFNTLSIYSNREGACSRSMEGPLGQFLLIHSQKLLKRRKNKVRALCPTPLTTQSNAYIYYNNPLLRSSIRLGRLGTATKVSYRIRKQDGIRSHGSTQLAQQTATTPGIRGMSFYNFSNNIPH